LDIIDRPVPFEPEVTVLDDEPPKYLVICLHGILSVSNKWDDYQVVTGRFSNIKFVFAPVSYSMAFPHDILLSLGENDRVEKTEERIAAAIDRHAADNIEILCHSNGTKVFSELSDRTKKKFDWVFFAGSICHIDDEKKLRPCSENIVNDCGVRDIWPVVLTALRPKTFGHTGVVGFNNDPITDRYFTYNHYLATQKRHFQKWILPVLVKDHVRRARRHKPGFLKVNAPYFLRFLAVAFLVALMAYILLTFFK
jgi:hypothetical protein